jgi:hypothetical protein
MPPSTLPIAPEERTLAALTFVRFGRLHHSVRGHPRPIIIWIVKKDSPVVSTVAKQAVLPIWWCSGDQVTAICRRDPADSARS